MYTESIIIKSNSKEFIHCVIGQTTDISVNIIDKNFTVGDTKMHGNKSKHNFLTKISTGVINNDKLYLSVGGIHLNFSQYHTDCFIAIQNCKFTDIVLVNNNDFDVAFNLQFVDDSDQLNETIKLNISNTDLNSPDASFNGFFNDKIFIHSNGIIGFSSGKDI